MLKLITISIPMSISILFFINCDTRTIEPIDFSPPIVQNQDSISIIDQTGKEWDITHAVRKYGMKAENFQYGKGPYAIIPITNPTLLSPNDLGYPSNSSTFRVIGVNFNNDIRAYPLFLMKSHEIVDEIINETPVAVAY